MKTSFALIFLSLLHVSVSSSSTNYYVNPVTGNDNWDGLAPTHTSGTTGPKGTLQAAISCADTNDILNLADCLYNESVVIGKTMAMTCSFAATIRNLTITDGSALSLRGPIVITGTLSLTNGRITTNDRSAIIVLNPLADAVQMSSGDIAGTIVRVIATHSTDAYLFTDPHTMIIPDGNQCGSTVLFTSHPGQQPPEQTGQAVNRYYSIEMIGQLQGTICLSYLDLELNGISEEDLTSFQMVHGSNQWTEAGGDLNATENYIEVPNTSLRSGEKWTLGQATHSLPIQLASFSANVVNGDDVELTWRTITETNNYGFYIQQRLAGSSIFNDLPNSFLSGHGTTIDPHDYRWVHEAVAAGHYFYRLKQIDFDGTTHYSDEQQVEISSLAGVTDMQSLREFRLSQNYPNPFNPSTGIQFSVDNPGFTTLVVFDMLGKEVATLFAGNAVPGTVYTSRFDASTLANGTYFYKLVNGSQTSLKKMLLLK